MSEIDEQVCLELPAFVCEKFKGILNAKKK